MAKEQDKGAKAVKKQKKRRNPIKFFKEVIAELKKVSWPTGKDLSSAVFAVIAFSLIVAVIVGVLDWVFGLGLGLLA